MRTPDWKRSLLPVDMAYSATARMLRYREIEARGVAAVCASSCE
jgi:hypothetical protein